MLNRRLKEIKSRIRSSALKGGYDPDEVKIVAVTKNVAVERIAEALELGITSCGENRLQEAEPKIKQLSGEIRWHFLGHLQTNKVKSVIGLFSLIHSLDSLRLARAMEKRATQADMDVPALIQVNAVGEKGNYGFNPGEVEDFITEIRGGRIKIMGLMTMAPYFENAEEARPIFRQVRELKEKIRIPGVELEYLSMGMTNDYHIAVEEGANMVRIGTALFGAR
ncbi:MAG: YggS family pyridoxal phosphate-dependent enzyme [Firmicutes bacterium]|nr:YggS family pyridoxal phosphate-dependent enzyme [Bacillota bacterium]